MKRTDELTKLIGSLSKSEKRYISLAIKQQKSSKAHHQLFQAIEKNGDSLDMYDKIPVNHLPVVKNYLYNSILKNLRNFHSESTTHVRIGEILIDIDILHRKKLTDQVRKRLDKLKKLVETENLELQLLYYMLERHLAGLLFNDTSENNLSQVHKKQRELVKQIDNLYEYNGLNDKLRYFLEKKGEIRSKADEKFIRDMTEEALFANVKNALSRKAKINYHATLGMCYYLLADYEKALLQLDEEAEIYAPNMDTNERDLFFYIVILNNKAGILWGLKKYAEAFNTVKKISPQTVLKNSKLKLSTISLLKLELMFYEKLMVFYADTANFEHCIKLIPLIDEKIKEYDKRPPQIYVHPLNYNFAYVCFAAGNYKQTLRYLERIFSYNKEELEIREDIYCFAKILYVLVHYELGTEDLPNYLVRSTHRFLSGRERIYKVEEAILSFIKNKLLKYPSANLLANDLKMLKEKLELVTLDTKEKKAFQYFDFIAWADSKISGRPFIELLKRKRYHPLPFIN